MMWNHVEERRHGLKAVLAGVAVALITLAMAGPLFAKEVLNPYNLAKLRQVSSVAISPDGEQIAYVLTVPRRPFEEEDGPAWEELHVVDREGVSRPYVTGEVNVARVAWTPDGKGVSFLAKRGKDEFKSLYLIPADGGEARRVVSHGADIDEYSWSPDGRRVAFLAREKKPDEVKELEEKGFNQEVFEEGWQPVKVWIATVEGEGTADPQALDLPGSASELHWSPVGSRLALALAPTPLIDDRYVSRKVHVVDADSGEILARIDNPGKLGPIAWSPDGGHLAFISAADPTDPREGRPVVVPASGGELRDLLPGYLGHVEDLAWKDAQTLILVGHEGVWASVQEVDRDGGGHRVLVPTGGPIWSSASVSRDGSALALLASTPKHPAEVFRLDADEAAPRRQTHSNPWLAEVALAPQEVVTYTARDGLELQGLLIRPLEEKPGDRYPLILVVHGGPEAHYSNGWLTTYAAPGQMAAARGFAVFYPNYRGSTGRGVEFSKLSQGDPAGKEFDDLVDGVEHLVASGLVDRKRVGITGGSYGGYASAWGATYLSEHFAAAVMFVGISDKISKFGTSDIPQELFQVHDRHWPWEAWQLFQERSPLYHVEKARTPILILHGKDDTRVHPSQSMELHRYLKVLGQVPVRLVFYPGEGHGNRRAASRLDYSLRLLRWMEHYLVGPGGEPPDYRMEYERPEKKDG